VSCSESYSTMKFFKFSGRSNLILFLVSAICMYLCIEPVNVTRLIRISFGEYDLNTIPPGLAIEVPCKPLLHQKNICQKRLIQTQAAKTQHL
jgi:hypothetical protein